MIRKLQINNYKSLHELTLEVGHFNVFIGENGCGKSNLLEAIALAAAAAANKLDHEFLGSRGIRVTEPQLMRSAFSDKSRIEPIEIGVGFLNLDGIEKYTLQNDNQAYAKWTRLGSNLFEEALIPINSLIKKIMEVQYMQESAQELFAHKEDAEKELKAKEEFGVKLEKKVMAKVHAIYGTDANNKIERFRSIKNNNDELKNFVIYSPENTALRNFYKEGQIEPLGINGEGLLKLLKVIQSKSPEQRQDIRSTTFRLVFRIGNT
jgi:AAA15 family ATPase/GTPase